MIGGGGEEAMAPAVEGSQPLDWKFAQDFGERTAGEEVQEDDPKKTEHLLSLDRAKERLQLFKADLLEEGSFDYALDGCQGVFHTASPVIHMANDPQSQIIDPAVKGTLNVLHSCAKVPLPMEVK